MGNKLTQGVFITYIWFEISLVVVLENIQDLLKTLCILGFIDYFIIKVGSLLNCNNNNNNHNNSLIKFSAANSTICLTVFKRAKYCLHVCYIHNTIGSIYCDKGIIIYITITPMLSYTQSALYYTKYVNHLAHGRWTPSSVSLCLYTTFAGVHSL